MAPPRERRISSRSNKLGKEDFFVVSSFEGAGFRGGRLTLHKHRHGLAALLKCQSDGTY
jgi:hypothetical protein